MNTNFNKREKMITLKGVPASPGVAIGKVYIYDQEEYIIPKYKIKPEQIKNEIHRFKTALDKTHKELKKLQKIFKAKVKDEKLDFFKMHVLILEDPYLKDSVYFEITEKNKNAEWALYDVMSKHIQTLKGINNEYFSERVADLYDLAKKIMKNLLKKQETKLSDIKEEVIVVSKNLNPSDTAHLDKSKIIGFATDFGGKTSHTAIVARALEIPAVVGLEKISTLVKHGDTIIVDGINGNVIIHPNKNTLKEYKTVKSVFQKYSDELKKLRLLDAITLDRKKIVLAGNIELKEEIDSVINHGGQGIGLFRTEFLYLNRNTLPSEKELFLTFKEAAEKVKPYPIIIRTLDVGGDKIGGTIKISNEENPFLGYRAIRFCLDHPEIFHTQLSAILKASYYGNIHIMIPMICSVSEIIQVKEILEKLKRKLQKKGIPFNKKIKIGAMIEIPSAALTSDIISKEVDFLSIGTNDLIQYTLAVDRNNVKISHLLDPFHISVLKLIKFTIDAAHKNNIPVHICGESAADPLSAVIYVGMNIDELSMSAIAIPEIKKLIRSIKYSDAKKLVKTIMEMETSDEIRNEVYNFIKDKIPEFLYKEAV